MASDVQGQDQDRPGQDRRERLRFDRTRPGDGRSDDNRADSAKDRFLPTTAEANFSLVLSDMIASIKSDPVQLRNAIYDLARVHLQREALQRHPPMSVLEM